MEIGTNLKNLIRSSGYKHYEIAKKLGVNESTVSRWVNDKTKPSYEQFVKLLDICGLTITRKGA